MTLATWLAVVTICILGAMSPGPSLALVLKQTLTGGRRNGVITALAHGIGVGIYAFLSILGLAAIITASPTAFTVLQWGGALYLAWLGVKGLMAKRQSDDELPEPPTTKSAARDWYLIVAWLFSNPKWLTLLRQKAVWFERIFGAILLGLAGRLVVGILNGK